VHQPQSLSLPARMIAVATAAAAHRVVVAVTRAAALVVAVRAQALIQVLARRTLRPSSLARLVQLLTVSAVALAVLLTAN